MLASMPGWCLEYDGINRNEVTGITVHQSGTNHRGRPFTKAMRHGFTSLGRKRKLFPCPKCFKGQWMAQVSPTHRTPRRLQPSPNQRRPLAFHSGLRRIAGNVLKKRKDRVWEGKIYKTEQRLIADIVSCSLPQISRHRGAIMPDHHVRDISKPDSPCAKNADRIRVPRRNASYQHIHQGAGTVPLKQVSTTYIVTDRSGSLDRAGKYLITKNDRERETKCFRLPF